MSITKQLKAAIQAKDSVLLRVAQEAEVDYGALHRFMNDPEKQLRLDTVQKLCDYLGLELQPKKLRKKK